MEENLQEKDKEFSDWMRYYYNKKIKERVGGNYEYYRWLSSLNKRRQYKFTTQALFFHLRNIDFKNCLEVGCGPGTWTKLLLKKYPNAKFTCLDISKEMIREFKDQIKDKNVKVITNNFLDEDFKNQKFDFFFCSRAIEYIPNKKRIINKVSSLLESGGKGIIVTSPPHQITAFFRKLFRKKANLQHTRRISVGKMRKLLSDQDFINIRVYPILFSDKSFVPTSFLFRLCYKKRWGFLSKLFASGYLVKFEKK